jgi:hypothetical protein
MCALATFAAMLNVPAASLPEADWERIPSSAASSSQYLDPFFSSRKTLAETTNWLRQTIERYGDVPQRRVGDDSNWTGEVRFNRCTMTWGSRRFLNGGTNLEERAYTLNLADIDSRYGLIQVTDQIKASMRRDTVVRWTTRYYTVNGGSRTVRGSPRVESDTTFSIVLRKDNDIPYRVAQALVHASRLCGGPSPSR